MRSPIPAIHVAAFTLFMRPISKARKVTLLLFSVAVLFVSANLSSAAPSPTPTPGCTDPWSATSTTDAPNDRENHTAIWTGSEMIVWGGATNSGYSNTGGRYNPGANSWTVVSGTNAPSGRSDHTAVWTGSEMIVWGGYDGSNLNSGGRYNPSTDTWTATSTTNAPSGRPFATAIWTGSEMIVWGGNDGSDLNSGGRYNPSTDTWTAMSTINAPSGRQVHTAVWTGSEMIVWGGYTGGSVLGTGGRYNPATDTWTATSTTNAPSGRTAHTAIWSGTEMIEWGGYSSSHLDTGGRYNPGTDTWAATSTTGAPSGRSYATAIWTGSEMIVWGGFDASNFFNSGGKYNPDTNSWAASTTINAPIGRSNHTAIWTGNEMIVWGGLGDAGFLNTGGKYCATSATPPSILGNISTRLRVETGDNVLIGGFIVTGTQPKRVIVRAIGPSLLSFFPGALADPVLELHGPGGFATITNDNWRVGGQESEILATGIEPSNDLESAIVATLPANNSAYTAIVRGVNNGTGIGVVEAYDLDRPADSKLANISTRGLVQMGDDVLIGGLIVLGDIPLRVIVRAIGPSLLLPGALENPTLELHDGQGAVIASNDDWRSDQEAEIIATGVPPTNDFESAIVQNLTPGSYTAIVRGVNSMTGIAVVEAYGLN
jgi:N-acetylneuraminic acid mutarotase